MRVTHVAKMKSMKMKKEIKVQASQKTVKRQIRKRKKRKL